MSRLRRANSPAYQGVAFPLADACSELQALYELALYSLNSVYEFAESALADALTLSGHRGQRAEDPQDRAHQVPENKLVMHQHHPSIITLTLQARLRLPFGIEECLRRLADEVEQSGFTVCFRLAVARAT